MWFEKAADTIPHLEVKAYHREFNISKGVGERYVDELGFLSTVLHETGGIYVNLNTIMLSDNSDNRQIDIGIVDVDEMQVYGFVAVKRQFNLANLTQRIEQIGDRMRANLTTTCFPSYSFKGHEKCCYIPNEIHPADIMREQTPFASEARFLFYGTSRVIEPEPSFPPIPKIVHYAWFGGGEMTYEMYLSFQSTLRFVKPTQIIMYVDSYDLGIYFEKMRNISIVKVVYYGKPSTVFQKPFKNLAHVSDFVRTEALLRYGGIYLDWDVFWLKPVDDLLTLGYETIAAFGHLARVPYRKDFPDVFNMGVVFARPGSRFIALWQDSFRKYTGEHPTFHAVEMVYKLYEERPDLLYIEKRLQVICFQLKCHPLWLPNYQDKTIHNEFNFTKDAYAVHFTVPLPKEFKSKEAMEEGVGFYANMARYVNGGP